MKKTCKNILFVSGVILISPLIFILIFVIGIIWNFVILVNSEQQVALQRDFVTDFETKRADLNALRDELLVECQPEEYNSREYGEYTLSCSHDCAMVSLMLDGYGNWSWGEELGYVYFASEDDERLLLYPNGECECPKCIGETAIVADIKNDFPNCHISNSSYTIYQDLGDGWYAYRRTSED